MPDIIDVLATAYDFVAGVEKRQTFTVAAANDVPINNFVAGDGTCFCPNQVKNSFAPKDNITILSIGISLPYNFVLSTHDVSIRCFWRDAAGTGALPIASTSAISIPFANYELSLGSYVPWPTPRILPYWLELIITTGLDAAAFQTRISCIGSPAALLAATLPITSFVKVSHNLPLV